jgi:hypothetical protein
VQQLDLIVGERSGLTAAELEGPDRRALAHEGHGHRRVEAELAGMVPGTRKLGGHRRDVGHVDHALLEHAEGGDGLAPDRQDPPQRGGERPVMGDEPHALAVPPPDLGVGRAAVAGRALHHRVEHRLEIGGRAADHAQDLRGGGLLGEAVGQLPVAALELGEEVHVLDRDDRLRRERLQEGELAVGERPRLHAADQDHPDGGPVAEERLGEHAPPARAPGHAVGELVGRRRHVADVNSLPIDHRPPNDRAAGDRHRPGRAQRPVRRGEAEGVPVDPEDLGVARVAQARRALGEGLHDRPQVASRAADGIEDPGGGGLLLDGLGKLPLELGARGRAGPRPGDGGAGALPLRLPGRGPPSHRALPAGRE